MMMQPYVNPYYFQNQQGVPMMATLRGKMVNSVNEITVNDVPMDGTQAVFVKNDLSEIYTKGWNADGTIGTRIYVPQIQAEIVSERPNVIEANNSTLEELKAEFEQIRGDIADLKNLLTKKPTRGKENDA